jgi:glycosyltransferase involved in cell wall biosynthesis
MDIGIDGSRAFLRYRTGIEEYSYQVIKHLREAIGEDVSVRLYVRKKLRVRNWRLVFLYPDIDFSLPNNWQLRGIWAPRFWTQLGLSLEMLCQPVNTLFVPAHTLPLIGGRRNIVTVHGLEYEVTPESYGFWERLYMRASIRYSCTKADVIIAVSENTKRDLMSLYNVSETKVQVVYEGFIKQNQELSHSQEIQEYILFIGRIEERKNVARIVEAFDSLKRKYQIPHELILVGKRGYGYEKIAQRIAHSDYKKEIQERGYVDAEEKSLLLYNAEVFVFPSLYEGFGLPVLEAQAAGIPVVTSQSSSLPEVGGEGALYVDPRSSESIASGIYTVLQMNGEEKAALREKGFKNLEKFSWEKCAIEIGMNF